jgi:hypothetical protein
VVIGLFLVRLLEDDYGSKLPLGFVGGFSRTVENTGKFLEVVDLPTKLLSGTLVFG